MRTNTFKIAHKYLENFDYSNIDLTKQEDLRDRLMPVYKLYEADKDNKDSNSTWRAGVFEAVFYHLCQKSKGEISYLDVITVIIEAHADILKGTYEKWHKTNYPKIMFDEFHKYCATQKDYFLNKNSEMRDIYFMSIYHDVIGD